jgi:hypothetical protein
MLEKFLEKIIYKCLYRIKIPRNKYVGEVLGKDHIQMFV